MLLPARVRWTDAQMATPQPASCSFLLTPRQVPVGKETSFSGVLGAVPVTGAVQGGDPFLHPRAYTGPAHCTDRSQVRSRAALRVSLL